MVEMTSVEDAAPPMRNIYRGDALRPLIAPRSIVVIGASQRPNSFGARALVNAIACDLPEGAAAVNPNYDALFGAPCWRSIAELPKKFDCAIIAVPAAFVVETVREAILSGNVASVLIFSSGLGEAGDEGARAETELAALARQYRVPICGPNTVGILNFTDRRLMTFLSDVSMDAAPAGKLGIVSQSAGLGVGLSHGRHTGLRLSHVLLAGNSCDVNVLDLTAYLLDHPAVQTVALALEGVDHPRGLLELGEIARRRGKTIVALKTGRGATAAAVVQSHTGSMIGTYELYEATFARAGIVPVETMEQLLEVGNHFAMAGRPRVTGVGVLTTSGGAAVMAADHADESKVSLPEPAAATLSELRSLAPDFAAISNPADLTANMSQDWSLLTRAILAFANDPAYAAVVVPVPAPDLGPNAQARPQAILDAARQSPVPICVVWLSAWREGPGIGMLETEPNVIVFRSMKRCMDALSRWVEWSAWLDQTQPVPVELGVAVKAMISALIDAALAESGGSLPLVLDEIRSRELLSLAGVPNARGDVAQTSEDAVRIAGEIGFPVVLKAVLPGVAHKSDVGAVALNLRDAAAVRQACADMRHSLKEHKVERAPEGFLVCQMLSGGFEAIVGASRDALFGPIVAFGAGGTAVEQLDDIELRLAPSNQMEIAGQMRRLKAWNALAGGRGAVARDIDAFVAAGVAVASLLTADPRIREIDVNPLLVRKAGEGVVALDALLTISNG